MGTLRCVQAIIKMQALVRARRARQLTEGTFPEKNSDVKDKRDGINFKPLVIIFINMLLDIIVTFGYLDYSFCCLLDTCILYLDCRLVSWCTSVYWLTIFYNDIGILQLQL